MNTFRSRLCYNDFEAEWFPLSPAKFFSTDFIRTHYPEEKLREEFGDEIVDAVCLLTHRERMAEAGYLEYISNLKASGNELAIAVKIADLTNNSDYTRLGVTCPEELQEKDRKRWEKYQKSQEILKGLE